MPHNVALLMVTFARSALFRDAISSFVQHTNPRAIVVVDNNLGDRLERSSLEELFGAPVKTASITLEDKTYKYELWRIGETVLYHLPSGANLGGAGGFRLGQEFARSLNLADYLYFTDDDVHIENDPFPPLLKILELTGAPFASSLIFNEYLAAFEMNQHKLHFDPQTLAEKHVHPEQIWMDSIQIEANGFVGVLCRAAACTQIGGVHAPYFVLYDDVDMTYRLTRVFGPGFLVPASRIIHHFQPGSGYPAWKVALQLRNRVIFARRCFSFRTRLRVSLQALRSAVRLRDHSIIFRTRVAVHLLSSFFGHDRPFIIQIFRGP